MSRRCLLQLENVDLAFPHRVCFEGFSARVYDGDRIAVIGQNGSGKSSLLKILLSRHSRPGSRFGASSGGNLFGKLVDAVEGECRISDGVRMGYVPQIVEGFATHSGAQRLNHALTQALALNPDVLLLDEPTNHLDRRNRTALMRMLRTYAGVLIVVSHDVELLRGCVDILWHIDQEKIHVFAGNYDAYCREMQAKRAAISREMSLLQAREKEAHQSLMKEQQRAARRKTYGEKKYGGDKLALRSAQDRGQATANKNSKRIAEDKSAALAALSGLRLPEPVTPKFSLDRAEIGSKTLITVSEGSVGYDSGDSRVIADINFSVNGTDRVAIVGDNGSGKSTLIKAIRGDANVTRRGVWHVPKREEIGYLDQHYDTLAPDKSVLATLQELVPRWSHAELRKRLNDFLFRKNDQIHATVAKLSGGEKARLCLACLSVQTPRLLLLDEPGNNLDLTAREHVIQVLREYPGAFLIISHDEDFLQRVGVTARYWVENKGLHLKSA